MKKFKMTKRLLLVLSMLVISATLLSTATFAWISMNTQVTAEGMTVKASASKNLLIRAKTGASAWTEFAFTATPSSGAKSLQPASGSATTIKTGSFFSLAIGKVNYNTGVVESDGSYEAAELKNVWEDTTGKTAVAVYTFEVKSDMADQNFSNLVVQSVTATNSGSHAYAKSLRVAFVCGENVRIYAPLTDSASIETQSITATGADGTPTATTAKKEATGDTTNDLLAASVTNSATTVTVYVWFEGTDGACNSANTTALNAATFGVTFTLAAE